jgi:hypothetical protein
MARRALPLIALVLSACRPTQPIPVTLQDTWSDVEREHILRDLVRWERATDGRVRFVPAPLPFHDDNGFDRADLDDGVSVIYKITGPSPDVEWLMQASGQDLLGYNFNTDILVFWYRVQLDTAGTEPLDALDGVVLHELGHHVGLSHLQVHRALMNRAGGPSCITQYDLIAFCSLYDCDAGALPAECVITPADDDPLP